MFVSLLLSRSHFLALSLSLSQSNGEKMSSGEDLKKEEGIVGHVESGLSALGGHSYAGGVPTSFCIQMGKQSQAGKSPFECFCFY